MSPEAIYVSSDDELTTPAKPPEIQCTGQLRTRKVPAFHLKKRESTAPRVPSAQPTELIVLDSDSDEPISTTAAPAAQERPLSKTIRKAQERQLAEQRRKAGRSRVSLPRREEAIEIQDSGDEERYAAYDLNYSPNWVPKGTNPGEGQVARDLQKEITDISEEFATLMPVRRRDRAKAALNRFFTAPASAPSKPLNIPRRHGRQPYVWTVLQRDISDRTRRIGRAGASSVQKWTTPAMRFQAASAENYTGFSPGSINSIAQAGELVAVASCTLGGGSDDEDDSGMNRPYNASGSLKVFNKDNTFTLHGHEGAMTSNNHRDGDADRRIKHYTVNEVQFDPANPTQLVSCGRDTKVIVWDCDPGLSKPTKLKSIKYRHVPEGVQFKPTGTTFVSWTEVGIHHGIDEPVIKQYTTRPEPVQSVIWGRGKLQNLVYFTTELIGGKNVTGKHIALDVEYTRPMPFSIKLAGGQCLDLDVTGTQLAHVTCASSGVLTLSVLDTRADYKSRQEITLPRFVFKTGRNAKESIARPYVQQVLFSPDSLYIAVARNDNVTLVYDARFLNKGPLYDLPHLSPDEGSEEDNYYGIPKIEWLEDHTRGLSLVSCGADGCLRLWDMKRAHDLSTDTVIAKSVSYAGWFSLGDTFRGEKALILGDGSGNLVVKN
ncbi:hypothetical protein PHLGIDRAFT_113670 [Phlebiopsis gigantea 11061_1 CR5-6]|uniref:WD40 repeat-like protein n=1 Tax=Phlebiopsis gigantea (strain 11061_1 CR5-6) TaxID=745531 RepID=A0A0C3P3S3_PHLG1|nr:hypothetical protein PHLGIDRAFT_113670 [Phlebiopsis gigantea 11061_1 CR5-6]